MNINWHIQGLQEKKKEIKSKTGCHSIVEKYEKNMQIVLLIFFSLAAFFPPFPTNHSFLMHRVATVREKLLEHEFFYRSGKSQGILWMAREFYKGLEKSGKSQGI